MALRPTDGSDETARLARALRDCEAAHARTRAEFERFLRSISHDLREPLRMVSSYCGLLQRRCAGGTLGGTLDREADEFLTYAADGARRMQSMLDALVDLSRIALGPCAREPVRCDEALDAAIDRLGEAFARSGARIEREPLPIVLGDAAKIAQVFELLCSNALEHRGGESPRIDVGAVREGDRWRLTVADRGPGIAPEHLSRVFEPFRSSGRRAEPVPGASGRAPLGVGLAFARAIVERHGGLIEASSRPGGGSAFSFTLPAADDGAQRAARP